MNKLLKNPIFIYSLMALAGLFLINKIFSIGDGIGDFFEDRKEEKEAKEKELKEAYKFLNLLLGINWVRNFLLPKLKGNNAQIDVLEDRTNDLLTGGKNSVENAKKLNSFFGFFNDNESGIIGIFKSAKTQLELALTAEVYFKTYKRDLYTDLAENLSNNQIIAIYNYSKIKPLY